MVGIVPCLCVSRAKLLTHSTFQASLREEIESSHINVQVQKCGYLTQTLPNIAERIEEGGDGLKYLSGQQRGQIRPLKNRIVKTSYARL